MIYHNIFLEFLLREIGKKFVNNCRKSCKVGVESSDIVTPEATSPVVYSLICLAVVLEGYVSHPAVCYSCLLWSKVQHKYFHDFNVMKLKIM